MTTIRDIYSDIYEPIEFAYKKVKFKECYVAGLSFHVEKDDEMWDELCVGTKLALVRDKNNKHDHNAVAIALADDFDGDPDNFDFDFILGYIPRQENAELAVLLDAGYFNKFETEITEYKQYGKYDERIKITIWLETNEPVMIRPDLLRAEYLDRVDFSDLTHELHERGVAYFRWGGFLPDEHDLPLKGERIVLIHTRRDMAYLYLMKVVAVGDDCAIYFDDPAEIHCCDDCAPFILSNMVGPVEISIDNFEYISEETLRSLSVDHYLAKRLSAEFDRLIASKIYPWTSLNNVDADPSIDDPEDAE